MKKILLLSLILLTQTMFSQKGFEIQVYQGLTQNFSRQKIKVLSTYEHFKGRSHLGLDFEKFKLSGYSYKNLPEIELVEFTSVGAFVEFGYAMTTLESGVEVMPLASLGWFTYDKRWGQRFLVGLDIAYPINYHIKAHLLFNVSNEKWLIAHQYDLGYGLIAYEYEKKVQNGNSIFIGLSYKN